MTGNTEEDGEAEGELPAEEVSEETVSEETVSEEVVTNSEDA